MFATSATSSLRIPLFTQGYFFLLIFVINNFKFWQKKVEQKEIRFVQQELLGQREHLISIHLRMQIWLLVNIVKTLTMERVKIKNKKLW
jgi:hypothetical protein